MTPRRLRGDHCRCPTCGEYFNSTRAFDKHRTGDWTARRCLSAQEMWAKGMVLSASGWWLTRPRTSPILSSTAMTGAAIGPEPSPGSSPDGPWVGEVAS